MLGNQIMIFQLVDAVVQLILISAPSNGGAEWQSISIETTAAPMIRSYVGGLRHQGRRHGECSPDGCSVRFLYP